MNKKQILIFLFTALFHLSGYYFLIRRIEPAQYFAYLVFWWSYIFFMDNLLSMKIHRYTILNRNLPFLIIISSGFWCIFELINLRLENWFYINLPANTFLRWTGYLLAYGTVIPAIYVTKEFTGSLLGEIKVSSQPMVHHGRRGMYWGVLALIGAILFPLYCFPFVWIFPVLVIDSYNYRKGYATFMREKEEGFLKHLIASIVSGLVCGILWETWNFWSISKWVYTVPFFENLKIFEMPLPGYLGFLFFSIGTIAFVNLLSGINVYRACLIRTTSAALILSLVSFSLIDRYTVFSFVAELDQLSFINKVTSDSMKAAGVKTSFGIDPAMLDEKEKAALDLVHVKGLGYNNYLKLMAYGVDSVYELSRLDENSLSGILNESNLRRVRVYLKVARETYKNK